MTERLKYLKKYHGAGLSASATQQLQSIQNAAVHLVFNGLKFFRVTPLLHNLNWLPVAASS